VREYSTAVLGCPWRGARYEALRKLQSTYVDVVPLCPHGSIVAVQPPCRPSAVGAMFSGGWAAPDGCSRCLKLELVFSTLQESSTPLLSFQSTENTFVVLWILSQIALEGEIPQRSGGARRPEGTSNKRKLIPFASGNHFDVQICPLG